MDTPRAGSSEARWEPGHLEQPLPWPARSGSRVSVPEHPWVRTYTGTLPFSLSESSAPLGVSLSQPALGGVGRASGARTGQRCPGVSPGTWHWPRPAG